MILKEMRIRDITHYLNLPIRFHVFWIRIWQTLYALLGFSFCFNLSSTKSLSIILYNHSYLVSLMTGFVYYYFQHYKCFQRLVNLKFLLILRILSICKMIVYDLSNRCWSILSVYTVYCLAKWMRWRKCTHNPMCIQYDRITSTWP